MLVEIKDHKSHFYMVVLYTGMMDMIELVTMNSKMMFQTLCHAKSTPAPEEYALHSVKFTSQWKI